MPASRVVHYFSCPHSHCRDFFILPSDICNSVKWRKNKNWGCILCRRRLLLKKWKFVLNFSAPKFYFLISAYQLSRGDVTVTDALSQSSCGRVTLTLQPSADFFSFHFLRFQIFLCFRTFPALSLFFIRFYFFSFACVPCSFLLYECNDDVTRRRVGESFDIIFSLSLSLLVTFK